MKGSTHALVGMTAVCIGAINLSDVSPEQVLASITLAGIGSLLPDIDHPQSFISRRFPLPLWLFTRHRGITHSAFAIIAWMYTSGLHWSITYLAWGYILHITADLFTKNGVRLFAPLFDDVIHAPLPRWMLIRTGGTSERFLAATCIILIAYIILTYIGRMQ